MSHFHFLVKETASQAVVHESSLLIENAWKYDMQNSWGTSKTLSAGLLPFFFVRFYSISLGALYMLCDSTSMILWENLNYVEKSYHFAL